MHHAERLAVELHVESEYPREACGAIVQRGDERRVLAWGNVQDQLHKGNPDRFPQDARTAFFVDPTDLQALARLEMAGWVLKVLYHSHVESSDHFSDIDREQALANGRPVYPDVRHVVVSVRKGRVAAMSSYRWDSSQRDFVKGVLL